MKSTANKVTRRTIGKFALTGAPAQLVVTLQGDQLHFRELRGRRTFTLPIEAAARLSVLHSVETPGTPTFFPPPPLPPAAPPPTPTPEPSLL